MNTLQMLTQMMGETSLKLKLQSGPKFQQVINDRWNGITCKDKWGSLAKDVKKICDYKVGTQLCKQLRLLVHEPCKQSCNWIIKDFWARPL